MAAVCELVSATGCRVGASGLPAVDAEVVPRVLAASGEVVRVARGAGVLAGCRDGVGR